MATKPEIIAQLKEKGIEADESMHPATLNKMLRDAEAPVTMDPENSSNNVLSNVPVSTPSEQMVPLSSVKQMIEEAMAQAKIPSNKPLNLKKVKDHLVKVYRFDGKWVVDFKDRNTDPYVKYKIHAYQKFNEQKREHEAWIELVFQDGSTKDIPLTTYVKNRIPIECAILKRHQRDVSYSMGEVEKRKEVGDKLVGTGVLVEQTVEAYEEAFDIRTPDGEFLTIPAYIVA